MDWQDLPLSISPSRGAALESVIQTFRPRPQDVPQPSSSLMDWLNQNSTIVYSAAAVLVVLALVKGRR